MARGRSKSIVQKIASDVPPYKTDQLDNSLNLQPTTFKFSRSKSLSNLSVEQKNKQFDGLYPFDKIEHESLWVERINSYNYNLILSDESISTINNILNENVLNFQNNCVMNSKNVTNLINETDEILNNLNMLILKYDKISSETLEFDNESNKLLTLQHKYESKINEIENYLKHFENLEVITRHLSTPGSKLVKRSFFNDILLKLDNSIEFIDSHENFKDIEIYKIRFRQCMTRSLTLIKDFLINELKSLNQSVNDKLDKKISIDLLLINEFNSYANNANFNQLVNEIIKRITNHSEYQGLLNDILNYYFKVRLHLLNHYVSSNSISNSSELVQACQDQISFFKKIIEKEHVLFKKFFILDEFPNFLNASFYDFLKDLLDPLYDNLRQLILKETNISKLCQLTTLLQKYYEFEETEYEINYGELFHPILSDVQSRLIFRIQIYVDEKLIKYKPKLEDLKVGNKKYSETELSLLDVDYPDNLFEDVYLPLGKALTLLSNIYELINSVVFDDLAHYIVHACIYILRNEFYKLSMTHLGLIDTKLNYLKHLIILKTQINNFDIQFTRNDYSIDFLSGFSDIWKFLKNGEFNFNNGLIELVKRSVPKIINDMIDANYEIELELNNAVNDFIKECINIICEPILIKDLIKNPLENSLKFKDNLSTSLSEFYKKITYYINDINIIKFLINNLSNLILTSYENFYQTLQDNLNKNEIISKEISDIMEIDELVKYLNDLISVLYETNQNDIKFNEDILRDLDIEDVSN